MKKGPRNSFCVVQHLQLWETAPRIELPHYAWMEAKFAKTFLPREIIVAAEQVQCHLDEPYQNNPEEDLRNLPKGFESVKYTVAKQLRRHDPPGWSIRWDNK